MSLWRVVSCRTCGYNNILCSAATSHGEPKSAEIGCSKQSFKVTQTVC